MRSVLNLKRRKFKTDLINKLDIPYQNPFERDLGKSSDPRSISTIVYLDPRVLKCICVIVFTLNPAPNSSPSEDSRSGAASGMTSDRI
jgi:hypothetical protein